MNESSNVLYRQYKDNEIYVIVLTLLQLTFQPPSRDQLLLALVVQSGSQYCP